MKKYLLYIFLSSSSIAGPQIILFVRDYPVLDSIQNTSYTQARRLLAHTALKSDPFPGIFATYAGYATVSSVLDGRILFPLKQANPVLNLMITPCINPVIMIGKTVHHFELIPGQPVACYSYTRVKDKKTELFLWQTSNQQPPKNNIIPLNTVVVFARPRDVYIPLGTSMSESSVHYLLPPLYIKPHSSVINPTMKLLNIKHFFQAVRQKEQIKELIIQKITTE